MSDDECLPPRLLRLKDIKGYLRMDIRIFNKIVRPFLIELPIGKRGKAFDRLDLDKWVDYYKQRSGRPSNYKRLRLWDVKERQDSTNVENSGTLTNRFSDKEFAKVLDQIRSKKRKRT